LVDLPGYRWWLAALGLRMTPYYQDESATIYNESCAETLKRMGDNSVDLVVTSPPYNMNLRIRYKDGVGKYENGAWGDNTKRFLSNNTDISTKYKEFDDYLPLEEYYLFHTKILTELLRVSEIVFYNMAVVTGSKRSLFRMIGDFNEQLKEIIIWDKGHGQPAMGEKVLNRRTELVLVFDRDHAISRQFKNNGRFERGTLDDIWVIQRQISKAQSNTAVFPEELVRTILTNFTGSGDTVYDPFLGTGTTAVVAKQMGRKSIGSEVSESLVKSTQQRLAQGVLFT